MKTLDEEIRHALTALEHAVPEGYFDALPARIMEQLPDHRLEVEAMGPDMSTDSSKPGSTPPPPQGGGEQRTENTGLHDIKAMARTTKQRISRRVSTQSDVEESLLASASSQSLSAIVLPEPGKDEPSYETDDDVVATPAVARAAASASPGKTESRGGLPFWVYGAVGAVAVAAVVFFVMRGGGKKTEVAQHDVAGPSATPMAAGAGDRGAPPAPGATPITPATEASPAVADPGSEEPAPVDGDSDQVVASAGEASADPAPASDPDRDDDGAARSRAASRGTASASKSPSPRPAASAPATTSSSSSSSSSSSPKADATKPKEPAKTKPADGKRSLDDLLDEASGGAVANKDLEGEAPAKPESTEPAKTDLSRTEIQSGMKKILGRVSACYDKYKEPGTVMIAVVIETSGVVSGADATGKFKNTETGLCVSEAVRRASFTSWEGKPKRFNYPFLLSD